LEQPRERLQHGKAICDGKVALGNIMRVNGVNKVGRTGVLGRGRVVCQSGLSWVGAIHILVINELLAFRRRLALVVNGMLKRGESARESADEALRRGGKTRIP
jgi:hypothetical protein